MLKVPKKDLFSAIYVWSKDSLIPFFKENLDDQIDYQLSSHFSETGSLTITAVKGPLIFTALVASSAADKKTQRPYQDDTELCVTEVRFSVQELSQGAEDFYMCEHLAIPNDNILDERWKKVKPPLEKALNFMHKDFVKFKKQKKSLKKQLKEIALEHSLPMRVKNKVLREGVQLEITVKNAETMQKIIKILQQDKK